MCSLVGTKRSRELSLLLEFVLAMEYRRSTFRQSGEDESSKRKSDSTTWSLGGSGAGDGGRERKSSSEDEGDKERVPNPGDALKPLEGDGFSERRLWDSIAAGEAGFRR